jgi:hypothetical protein
MPALRTLYLEGNLLRSEGAGAVVLRLGQLAAVQTLDLRDNKLGPSGGVAVGGALPRLTALRALDLEGNDLGSEGGVLVAQGAARLGSLEALDLRHNSLGPEGCRSVRALLSHLDALRVDLGWNDVSGVEAVERMRAVITTKAIDALRARKRDSQRALYAATMRGNLQKLGQGHDPESDAHWRDRLCFVSNGSLYYESVKKKGANELVTPLSSIRSVNPPPVDTRPGRFMFTVEVEEGAGRAMTFAAATAHERKRWITALLRQRPEEPTTPFAETSVSGTPTAREEGSNLRWAAEASNALYSLQLRPFPKMR